jgi:hypothetical protein
MPALAGQRTAWLREVSITGRAVMTSRRACTKRKSGASSLFQNSGKNWTRWVVHGCKIGGLTATRSLHARNLTARPQIGQLKRDSPILRRQTRPQKTWRARLSGSNLLSSIDASMRASVLQVTAF